MSARRVGSPEWRPSQLVRYSMCRTGALAAPPSKDSATRAPLPVTISATGLPVAQSLRLTTSCTTDARFDVRWASVRALAVGQSGGAHVAVAVVRGRLPTSPATAANVAAFPAACPAMVRL